MRLRRPWRGPPRVSVIIASYRWPEVLRVSLASALAQTMGDLEVLVVEDGADEQSRAVAAQAADRRVRWMALQPEAGSQSGPNALGVQRARAPVVAYLGHDDVWHPDHLARLLDVLGPDTDIAHAVTLFLGAGADTRVEIAGSRAWRQDAFVPPSSIAHRRDSPRVGAWAPAEASGLPVDYAFLMTSSARGARYATSGVPTVFKYPAAWRMDSYRTRDATPQLEICSRLAGEADLGGRLVAEALAAGASGDLPAPPAAPPGVIADYNRRMKGLPARFAPPLTRWVPSPTLRFPGWHDPEHHAAGDFAWTGPQARAFVRLDAPLGTQIGVRVVVRHVVLPEQLDELSVDLDGERVVLERAAGGHGATVLTGWLGRPARQSTVEVGITTTPVSPTVQDPSSRDVRCLGVAVAEIALFGSAVRGDDPARLRALGTPVS